MKCSGSMPPNGQDNRRTGRASGLIEGLGRLGEVLNTRPTERTTRKEYHLRLPERDVVVMPNIEWTVAQKKESGIGMNEAVRLTKVLGTITPPSRIRCNGATSQAFDV